MKKLNKGQIFLKCMAHALLVGLEQIPVVGAIVNLGKGWYEIIEHEQNQLSLEERVAQLEEAARIESAIARQLALTFLQEKQQQGVVISEEKIAAICDLLAFTPATIKEYTASTLSQAKRYGTDTTTVLPIGTQYTESEREIFYRSLFPARRPRFKTGDALVGSQGWILGDFLGSGGFGEVWEANKLGLRRAVKFCLDERSAKMLKSEAKNLVVLSDLEHPNVVRLVELNLDSEPYWLAFDFIAGGGNLEALLRAKSLTLQESLDLFTAIVEGIAAVHRKGVVHRDLKPSNILLTADNKPKISDFGIGKVLAENAVRIMSTTKHTALGYGTEGYMSPEQKRCEKAHFSDDTYALGVILWQMLMHTLRPPEHYELNSLPQSDIPDTCKTIITECLFKPRGERPQDGSALLALLGKSTANAINYHRLENGLFAPEMIVLPKGEFMMGSNDYDSEKPVHKVIIAQPFAMSKYQLTFDDYDEYCEATGAEKPYDRGWGRGKRPVINVTWHDAQKYCQWLSEQTGYEYRLPTEAEWEYACRAGSSTKWCFGDDESQLQDYAWYDKNSGGKTHPVGEKKSNKFGLYDMHGNVWEWCEDSWHKDYDGAPNDGSAWKNSNENRSLLRGGSWDSNADNCRSAYRNWFNRDDRYYNVGVRLVCGVRA
jgi:formylglycine-generating enzyme required for sulfatase activity